MNISIDLKKLSNDEIDRTYKSNTIKSPLAIEWLFISVNKKYEVINKVLGYIFTYIILNEKGMNFCGNINS